MKTDFYFSFEKHWLHAPLAYWVHVPLQNQADKWEPPAPPIVLHKGYAFLHVVFEKHELVFSSPAQLDHCIAILSAKPLPTSRYLSSLRGNNVGPNGHWLSRLPVNLKSPRKRKNLVCVLSDVREKVVQAQMGHQLEWVNPTALDLRKNVP